MTKCINYVYPYEEIMNHKQFKTHTKLDIQKLIEEKCKKSCNVVEYPFSLCYLIHFDINNDNETEKLYNKLQPLGIIKLLSSLYKELTDIEYTMLKYSKIEITEEILNNYRRKE